MGSFFGGGGTTSDSYSGLRGLGLDTAGFGQNAISDTGFGSTLFKGMANNGYKFPTLDSNGLFPQQTNSVNSLLSQALGQFSGAAAGRGQLSPENQAGVASSTLQNILPQLMPMQQQNLTNAYQMPVQNQQNAGNLFQNFLGNYNPLLGSQTNSKTTAPGLGYIGAGSFLSGFGNTLGKSAAGGVSGGLSSMFGGV